MKYIKIVYFQWYMCWLIIHQNNEKHLIQSVLKLNLINFQHPTHFNIIYLQPSVFPF